MCFLLLVLFLSDGQKKINRKEESQTAQRKSDEGLLGQHIRRILETYRFSDSWMWPHVRNFENRG